MSSDVSGTRRPNVGVIGAGMSGLAATHYLTNRGADVTVFEASARPGGVVGSTTVDGRVIEFGPQRLRLSKPVETLVDEYELRDALRFGHDDQPLFAYYEGELRPMPLSVDTALRTDLLSWRGKARILAEPLTGPAKPDETVSEFLGRKFGTEAADRFMAPLYSGLYGTDPADMYVEYSLGRALEHVGIDGSILLYVAKRLLEGVETPPIVTFEDGLQTLPNAIYETHADDIHLDTPVTALERDGDGFTILTDDGGYSVDSVVVTTPAPTAASLLERIDGSVARTLDRFTYNPIGVVHLESGYDREGHGFHVIDDGFITNGSTWNHSMLDREGIYTSYVGSGDTDLLARDEKTIGEKAALEFESITGSSASPLSVEVLRPGMPAYDRSWAALDELSIPDGIAICSSYTSRAGIVGRIVDGKRTAETVL
ncbi:protoporphyrinogen oxidase [Halanaeroarchaeum sp. HSR-CO]|uniref:protoporphyrinogen oxidase n=1 Tax=Halanaeroarchaeum sp. HSR-CO TaxID=2866382 RepID=UPI00217DC5C6|nr:protoporphyrinogen oxidase [Halanaeroarchaeum sp. HSR-CO]